MYQQIEFNDAVECLGQQAREFLSYLPEHITREAQELRLRVGSAPVLTVSGRQVCPDPMQKIGSELIEDIFFNICDRSVYSHQEQISSGYLTVGMGHRAGLCGTAVYDGANIISLREISSINLRIARMVSGCSDELLSHLFAVGGCSGVLIVGAPCSGKTTMLRDMADALSRGRGLRQRKVAIIDERGEIAGMKDCMSAFGLEMCDILNGFNKPDGLRHAVRCLAPDVVICDEIGGEAEAEGVAACVNGGVCVIASIHAGSVRELAARPQFRQLAATGAFSSAVMLDGADSPGHLCEIIPISSLI